MSETQFPMFFRMCLILLFLLPGKNIYHLNAQQKDKVNWNFSDILRDSLLFHAEIIITSTKDDDILWQSQINKITVPGREVDVLLEGKEGRLKAIFTIFPAADKHFLLVAKNETWYEGQYNSAMTTFPMDYQDEVLYYPLGRIEDTQHDQPMEISMKVRIESYIETLDESSRWKLESILDSSSHFNLDGKGR